MHSCSSTIWFAFPVYADHASGSPPRAYKSRPRWSPPRKMSSSRDSGRRTFHPNSCPKRDETVTSFATLKSLISRGSSDGEDWCDSSVSVPRSDNRGPVVTPIGTAVTPFPAEDLQQMIAAYKAGASLYTIACEWKLGKQTVRRKLDEAGVRIRRKGLDDEQVVRAVSGYESGQTIREVAADLGVGHSMVWRALKKAGVELRDNVRRVGRKLSSQ